MGGSHRRFFASDNQAIPDAFVMGLARVSRPTGARRPKRPPCSASRVNSAAARVGSAPIRITAPGTSPHLDIGQLHLRMTTPWTQLLDAEAADYESPV